MGPTKVGPIRSIMSKVFQIHPYGTSLKIIYDDKTTDLALPTSMGVWIISTINDPDDGENPTDPTDPPPPVGDEPMVWPFPWSSSNIANGWPDDGFHTAGRPNHEGIDFGYGIALNGAQMRAAGAGTVIIAGEYYGYGNTIVIDHGTINGKNYKSLYGHMQWGSLTVGNGDTVTQKQVIGRVGNTGNSFGAHLHFEIWENDVKVDPQAVMSALNPGGASAW